MVFEGGEASAESARRVLLMGPRICEARRPRRRGGQIQGRESERPPLGRSPQSLGRRAREARQHQRCAREVRRGSEVRAELEAAQGSTRRNCEAKDLDSLPKSRHSWSIVRIRASTTVQAQTGQKPVAEPPRIAGAKLQVATHAIRTLGATRGSFSAHQSRRSQSHVKKRQNDHEAGWSNDPPHAPYTPSSSIPIQDIGVRRCTRGDGSVIECRYDMERNVLLTVKPTKRTGTCESSDYW